MDKEREAFEAWCVVRRMKVNMNGAYYALHATQMAWEGWQARAKQTITLPVKDATGEH